MATNKFCECPKYSENYVIFELFDLNLQFILLKFDNNHHLQTSEYKNSLLIIFGDKCITSFEVKPALINYEL